MPVLRLLLAGLIALVALGATLLAATLVLLTGFVGFVLQLFRSKPARAPQAPSRNPKQPVMRSDGVIDVVATKVQEKP